MDKIRKRELAVINELKTAIPDLQNGPVWEREYGDLILLKQIPEKRST